MGDDILMKKTLSVLLALLIPTLAFSASENLDEIDARKSRVSAAPWGKAYFENPTTLVWPPETLQYTDSVTGHEVWRMIGGKLLKNSLPDLGHAHYSADGARFAVGSNRDTSACVDDNEVSTNQTYQGTPMVMRSDGSYLRPTDNGPFETFVGARYLNWNTVTPDVYYGFSKASGGVGSLTDELYKTTVSDTSISKTLAIDIGSGGGASVEHSTSPDGQTMIAFAGGILYVVDVSTQPASLIESWSQTRALDSGDWWGNSPLTMTGSTPTWHYIGLHGVGASERIYQMQDGYSGVWSMELTGTAADGGPEHIEDHTAPYDWGGIRPVHTSQSNDETCAVAYRSPWCCDGDAGTDCDTYLSHNTYDRWGKYLIGMNSSVHRAFGIWDLSSHTWVDHEVSVPSYDWHFDWNSWSDYFAASPSSKLDSFSATGNIKAVLRDGSTTFDVAVPHTREMNSTDYNSLPRVTQSPDGTKYVFHSDFLQSAANAWDVFYAVAYYPHPPEITSVSGSGTYTIRWDWRTDQTTSRGYTQRGWPDEATDDPPPPRETKLFRLWRSTTGTSGWTPVTTVNAEIFSRYNFATGVWSGNNYWTVTDTPGAGTFYYAVTAMEHSGLESRVLSNVFSTAGTQTAAYPADPKADDGVTATYQSTAKRYYNIYAEDGATPTISQTNRIASVPLAAGESYIDWLGNTAGTTQYAVTAVDTQGNESSALTVTATHKQSPATADGQYTLSWGGSGGTGTRYRVGAVINE
jgi:hypothetical protein